MKPLTINPDQLRVLSSATAVIAGEKAERDMARYMVKNWPGRLAVNFDKMFGRVYDEKM
jgi:hypothetical protein